MNRSPKPECIRLRGVRQNNLKGFDLDLPLGRYIVVTGLSGAGKSSLVFDTLHAEGQRRYVETFSAYTRQFLDLLDKPKVDSIENVRPSIAIEQSNTVKTSRSTVGTMTELTDFAKVWFSQVAGCFDPETGEKVEDDDPRSIWDKARAAHGGRAVAVAFEVRRPEKLPWAEIVSGLRSQGYARLLLPAAEHPDAFEAAPLEGAAEPAGPSFLVLQDRVELREENRARFLEAAEAALHFGRGELRLLRVGVAGPAEAGAAPPGSATPATKRAGSAARLFQPAGRYSRGLHSPSTGRTFRAPTPGLFSFNSPLGACPRCRGFGRIIEIDYRLAVPDPALSIDDGAIKCWEGKVYGASKDDLKVFARRKGIRTDVPFGKLPAGQREYVMEGEPGYGEENGKTWPKYWYGVKGFFRWLEKTTYKMHVRVFLSRYRAYNPCPDCGGARLQPESLCWKWRGLALPGLYALPVSALRRMLEEAGPPSGARTGQAEARAADLAYDSMLTRMRYLEAVGLGYLTLDRPSKTLSGGEVQRVNLTGCLGTSLVDTLFVMDEPSVGLHARDVRRLIGLIRSLTDAGNTVVVVEHDEAMIRAADHVVEIGPEPGARGGRVVFSGSVAELERAEGTATGDYLSGRRSVPAPAVRRPEGGPWLEFAGATKHNLRELAFRLPLQRFVCLSGVSGSGKSTLLEHVIGQGLRRHRGLPAEDPARIGAIRGDEGIGEIVTVDQSPVARTTRSNAALYTGAWEHVRELYAATPAARAAGFDASSFSFNGGDGRCDHCKGLGAERVEMQFLSDVFVPCPVCEGRRFKPEVLAIAWNGRSVADLLATGAADAARIFAEYPAIHERFAALEAVGLGYLPLGQPLNTLSGGEAQRLKLVRYLSGFGEEGDARGALLLLDEPTTGLHRHDVKRLLDVMQALVRRGHSLVVIEHNLDVLKSADWILEIGPEAGADGGRVVAEGPPESVARGGSATAPFLRQALGLEEAPVRPEERAVAEDAAPAGPSDIQVIGAREHNLRDLSVSFPRRALSVVTGVSGSGKSTLAFDIVFAEGQRRFLESISPYARQFVEQLPRPAVDRLTGIPPTVAIEQRVTRGSRKSTVATLTEVAPYLRLLYARVGVQHHPETDRPVEPLSPGALRRLLARALAGRRGKSLLCAPLVRGRKGHHQPIADWIRQRGYARMRVDGRIILTGDFRKLDRYREHDVEAVVAELPSYAGAPKGESLEPAHARALDEALRLGRGSCFLARPDGAALGWFSTERTDARSGESFPELDPKHFSFNSPRGWCPACRGHGEVLELGSDDEEEELPPEVAEMRRGLRAAGLPPGSPCPECGGTRLNRVSRAVKLRLRGRRPALSLPELLARPPGELMELLGRLELDARGRLVARDILPEIAEKLRFLGRVGLDYLAMDRSTDSLSGGEAQRIRLAAQLGSNLSGVLYVLDEPSIGLHARDNDRLIESLLQLRDKGNTLLVVEHDEELMRRADRLVDLGPGAGVNGGRLLANAAPAEVMRDPRSETGRALAAGMRHPLRGERRPLPRPGAEGWLELAGARLRNLRGHRLRLPLGRLVMVAGPSGAGKSTLFHEALRPALERALKAGRSRLRGAEFGELRLGGKLKSVIEVDQSPIGKTPRSTPATYLGIFDVVRQFFASLPESRLRGHTASRFSFNAAGGRCPVCEGAGRIRLEMAFMPDAYLPCDGCRGLRYGSELSQIAWKGKSIGEVLQLSFEEAAAFFDFHAPLAATCRLMVDCGLGYLTLGQSSPTLSGGEAQRLKLVTELSRGFTRPGEQARNLYLLEEPTIGLHLSDCEKLVRVLHALVDRGHSVVVIEHHADLLAEADWLVELGPGGGPQGGRIVYQGPVEGVLRAKLSPTAPYLRKLLKPRPRPRSRRAPSPHPAPP